MTTKELYSFDEHITIYVFKPRLFANDKQKILKNENDNNDESVVARAIFADRHYGLII